MQAPYEAAGSPAAPELGASASDALLPAVDAEGFAAAFLLAAMRPDALRWLGRDRLARLAAPLGMRSPKLAALLDSAPPVPALGEAGGWSGLRVPLRLPDGAIAWAEISWRPDRGRGVRLRDQGAFALRLRLPGHGAVEIRGRLEGSRLDAVMEVQHALPQPVAADISRRFAELLQRLDADGVVTLRNGRSAHRT